MDSYKPKSKIKVFTKDNSLILEMELGTIKYSEIYNYDNCLGTILDDSLWIYEAVEEVDKMLIKRDKIING